MTSVWSRAAPYESLTRWSIASARTLPRPDEAIDDVARRLARAEAGHLRALGDVPIGGREVAVDLVGLDLDLEDHLRARLGSRRNGDHAAPVVSGRQRRRSVARFGSMRCRVEIRMRRPQDGGAGGGRYGRRVACAVQSGIRRRIGPARGSLGVRGGGRGRRTAVAVIGDPPRRVAVRLGRGRRHRAEPVDEAVVHREGGRDEDGELHVAVGRAGRRRGLDVIRAQLERVVADDARDVEEGPQLRIEPAQRLLLELIEQRRAEVSPSRARSSVANAACESMQ